jgi:hypothetical protein
MYTISNDHAPVVHWLFKYGGARISTTDMYGWTALAFVISYHRHSLLKWMLEEDGEHISTPITDGTMHRDLSISNGIWQAFSVDDMEFTSVVKVMVLLKEPPPNFITKLSPYDAEIAMQGRKIRVFRP